MDFAPSFEPISLASRRRANTSGKTEGTASLPLAEYRFPRWQLQR